MVEAHWDGVLNQIEGRFSTMRKFRLVHSPTKVYGGSQPYEILCWFTALRNSRLVHSPTGVKEIVRPAAYNPPCLS